MSNKFFINSLVAILLTGCANKPTQQTDLPQAVKIASIPEKPNQILEKFNTYNPPKENFEVYSASSVTGDYAGNYSVQNFIRQMVVKHGFSEDYLNGLFSQANRLESVIRLESPAPSQGPTKPREGSWTRYRNKFLTEAHINDGVKFWRNHADSVDKASADYRVDPEYIIAIIGVETYFGKNIGKTCVFDALTTLAFDTYRRSKFFTSELENFLLMAREEGYEPKQPVGSWAGAMGLGQFMPSSFRRLAVDFDHNGRRDIWHPEDAIGSVANYFSRSGWKFNQPVTHQTTPSSDASVIELSTYQGNEYWQVYSNFKVIKRYNNSNKYAMAVHQLAQAIKQRYY